jgi:methionine biosynthesis protein MetW
MSAKPQEVLSPITHKPAELIDTIPTKLIVDLYKEDIDTDVSAYFNGATEIYVYKCLQTGYRFYYPFDLPGDAAFYEALQKYDWYYAEWKWDYDAALPFIKNGSKVLDIGCGYGNFLRKLKNDKNCDCTGLEFNDKAIATGRERGLTMHKAFIQDYAASHKNEYDYVCYFQVLEHIQDIDSFVTAALECVKPGGKMIICVPNNNPHFYHYYQYHSMNMPPHHMGLWDESTFRKLTDVYPMKVVAVVKEKLKRYRLYTKLYINEVSKGNPAKRTLLNLFKIPLTALFVLNRNKVDAGSILVVYEK